MAQNVRTLHDRASSGVTTIEAEEALASLLSFSSTSCTTQLCSYLALHADSGKVNGLYA